MLSQPLMVLPLTVISARRAISRPVTNVLSFITASPFNAPSGPFAIIVDFGQIISNPFASFGLI